MNGETRNFGDALHEVFLDDKTREEWLNDEENVHFTIGSVICNEVIEESLDQGFSPIFHDCGWRGESLDESLAKHCTFYGARGPRTQEELARVGVIVPVTLDPAYKVPTHVKPGTPNGLAISIRHIQDLSDYSIDAALSLGADALFSPVVQDRQDVLDLIEKISGARFVLAGAMHAAIIAHAYEVPFALLDTGYVNCPPKWEDWLASIEITNVQWVDNVIEGRQWHKTAVLQKED